MTTRNTNPPSHYRQAILFKIAAFSVPAGAVLASALFPLTPFVRQALVGVILIWIMLGALLGFSFMG